MRRLFTVLGLVLLVATSLAPLASAQSYPFCQPGQTPQFVFGFKALVDALGDGMGEPVECEHANPQNGDALQQTTRGLSFYRKSTNTPTFTTGWEHWALTAQGLVYWTGESIDPPETASPAAPAGEALPPDDDSGNLDSDQATPLPTTPTPVPPTATRVPPTPTPTATRAAATATRTPQPTAAQTVPAPAPSASATPRWAKYGYTIPAPTSLWPVFEYLQDKAYTWVLGAFTKRGTEVAFYDLRSIEAWGVYLPEPNVVLIDQQLKDSAKDSLAALLIHEGTHINDDLSGRLRSFNECVSSERKAAEHEATFWQNLWGRVGKPGPANDYERQLNELVRYYADYREQFDNFVREVYFPQCSRFGS